jgi:hypothetical protein
MADPSIGSAVVVVAVFANSSSGSDSFADHLHVNQEFSDQTIIISV